MASAGVATTVEVQSLPSTKVANDQAGGGGLLAGKIDYRLGDVLYTALPLFHGWARGMLFAALAYSLELHLDAEFSASNVLRRLAETRGDWYPDGAWCGAG